MKRPLLACLLTLCSFAAARGQGATPKPMTKANTVLIQTPDSAATALRKLAEVFVSQGYTVEKIDNQFFTLLLAPKVLSSPFSPSLIARASASAGAGSVLRLSGDYKAFVMGHVITDVAQVAGSEKGVALSSFRAIERAALAYPNGRISYGRQ